MQNFNFLDSLINLNSNVISTDVILKDEQVSNKNSNNKKNKRNILLSEGLTYQYDTDGVIILIN